LSGERRRSSSGFMLLMGASAGACISGAWLLRVRTRPSFYAIIQRSLPRMGRRLHKTDAPTAFLKGDPYKAADPPVWLQVPKEVRQLNIGGLNKKFVRLRKALYGLSDAPIIFVGALSSREARPGGHTPENEPSATEFKTRHPFHRNTTHKIVIHDPSDPSC
jgi:hypothetical protein